MNDIQREIQTTIGVGDDLVGRIDILRDKFPQYKDDLTEAFIQAREARDTIVALYLAKYLAKRRRGR